MKADEIAALLPTVFRRTLPADAVLSSLLAVLERLEDPIETRFAGLAEIFDPIRTDDRFVPMLARWVDLEWLYADDDDDPAGSLQAWLESDIPVGRMRLLISASSMLSQRRGTAGGLRVFLEIATGVSGFHIDDAGPRPFHLVVGVPEAALPQMGLIERIVDAEKPAYTTREFVPAPTQTG